MTTSPRQDSLDPARDCWFLTGATATGKTAIAMALAQRLDAEIVSLDSMAIYRGMDIGTAKPGPAERTRIAHHLLDVVDPSQEYSVAQYREAALAAVADVLRRGRQALFVGGTPLYLKAMLRGLFAGPPANWALREEIEREAATAPPDALHARLEQIDPVAASTIHPHDRRRLIRALEVHRATGQPISHQQMEFEEARPAQQCRVFVLQRPRDEQARRIERRVEAMLAQGLVDEVRRIQQGPTPLGRTARQAVGYREVLGFLAGEFDAAAMEEKIKARTRQFAKRQGTWFRSLSECRFVDLRADEPPEEVADRVAAAGATRCD